MFSSGIRRLAALAVFSGLVAALCFVVSLQAGWAERSENLWRDAWHRQTGMRHIPQHTALVLIDEATLARYADTPLAFWTPYFAQAIDTLRGVGVKLVVLDFIFSGSPSQWLIRLGAADPEKARNYDLTFRQMLAKGDVVLAGFMHGAGDKAEDYSLPNPELLLSLPDFDVAGHVGLTNLVTDADGVVRHFRTAIGATSAAREEGLPRYSLAALAAKKAGVSFADDALQPIVYAGPPGSMPHLSFARLTEPDARSDPDIRKLAGKVVIIGTGYAGMNDVHPTPYSNLLGASDRLMGGPEIQANIVETLLAGHRLRPAPPLAETAIVLLAACLMAVILLRWGIPLAFVCYGVFLILVAFAGLWAFKNGWLLDAFQIQIFPALALVSAGIGKLSRSERERERIASMFGRYVSEGIVRSLLEKSELPALGGERREITVLFSDIQNFTTLSELLQPEEVVELLNGYFERACETLLAAGATIDKFIGDAIMAEFGAPLPQADHADRALDAAVALQRVAGEFAGWVKTRFPDRGLPEFAIGIGLHTGPAVVGNIGSHRRMEYTAIGDTVNTASRLEGLTRKLGCPIVVSRQTHDAAASRHKHRFGTWHQLEVKGRREAVEVVELWP